MSLVQRLICACVLATMACSASACIPVFYRWSYDHAASPVATSAYIRAVMAAEAGEDAQALYYYEIALAREDSPKAREERDRIKKRLDARRAQ